MHRFFASIILLFCVAANAQIPESIDVSLPSHVQLPGNRPYTLDVARKGILAAVIRREWKILNDAPGVARIKLTTRAFNATLIVDVIYNEKEYSFKYISGEGAVAVNVNASRWIGSLIDSINNEALIANL